jgi:hypothetical protein
MTLAQVFDETLEDEEEEEVESRFVATIDHPQNLGECWNDILELGGRPVWMRGSPVEIGFEATPALAAVIEAEIDSIVSVNEEDDEEGDAMYVDPDGRKDVDV